jgi:hypothetical protein
MVRTQKALEKNVKTLNKKTTTTKKPRKTKKEDFKFVFTKSKDDALFPHAPTFPWRLDDRKEGKTCWFQCQEHVEKYLTRYKMTSKEYKCQLSIKYGDN